MKKSKSSGQWLKEHEDDKYVKLARQAGYRSRASYKLLEINEKYDLLKSGSVVVDLGAAPGGWLQVAVKSVGAKGKVVGLDLLEIEPVPVRALFRVISLKMNRSINCLQRSKTDQ